MLRIIFLGAPGGGKDTHAQYFADDLKVPLIATGEMLRAAAKSGSALGLKVKQVMEEGKLVADDLIIQLLQERIKAPDCTRGYFLNGFPRTLAQAQALGHDTETIEYIVEIDVPDAEIMQRLGGRRVHASSGRVYHLQHKPPKQEGKDDITGEALMVRDDDKPEVIKKRLQVYHEQTQPLIGYYQQLAKDDPKAVHYFKVDGVGTIDAVRERIKKALDNF
jgi:adenylate kinase